MRVILVRGCVCGVVGFPGGDLTVPGRVIKLDVSRMVWDSRPERVRVP